MADVVTFVAPVNIASIKYWGKRDESLILPLNDSVSVTISVDVMHAKTTVSTAPNYEKNQLWLNGREETVDGNERLTACITEIKNRARTQHADKKTDIFDWKIRICSENNFPTAAGLASSAAGYACLVAALARLYNLEGDLTELARRGSGSACRSLHGGFVRWHMGTKNDGSDSIATQIASANHWPELRILILIVKKDKKATSSTSGMKMSVETSELLQHRVKNIVPKRTEDMIKAIKDKNFPLFAEITMKDSNQFHAVCLDTYPPAVYMTDVSHSITSIVHAFNAINKQPRVAYTFDAGANACLFFQNENTQLVISMIEHYFPPDLVEPREYRGFVEPPRGPVPDSLLRTIAREPNAPGLIKGLILANVGDGPIEVENGPHLLDAEGFPVL